MPTKDVLLVDAPKRDGRSVRDLLSQRDAPFQDYRERGKEDVSQP